MGRIIPKNLLKDIPDLYETQELKNPICHIKLFTPDSNWTWYITEYSKDVKDTCFGYIKGLENELGYFSLNEIESIRGAFGLKVELDLCFNPTPLLQIKDTQ